MFDYVSCFYDVMPIKENINKRQKKKKVSTDLTNDTKELLSSCFYDVMPIKNILIKDVKMVSMDLTNNTKQKSMIG